MTLALAFAVASALALALALALTWALPLDLPFLHGVFTSFFLFFCFEGVSASMGAANDSVNLNVNYIEKNKWKRISDIRQVQKSCKGKQPRPEYKITCRRFGENPANHLQHIFAGTCMFL